MPPHDRLPATLYLLGVTNARSGQEGVAAPGDAAAAAAAIRRAGAAEAAVLSTLSHLECYVVAHGREAALGAVAHGLRATGGADPALPAGSFVLQGEQAARHLLRTACGLEPGSVGGLDRARRAYDAAQSARAAGPLLHRVFQGALQAGEHARTEPGISETPGPVTAARVARDAAPEGTLSRIERLILDELEKIDEWRVRREVFATVMA